MACNICGSSLHEVTAKGCPDQGWRDAPMNARHRLRLGWLCPACGKGNAPFTRGCVHCAVKEPPIATSAAVYCCLPVPWNWSAP
jgi:hypothetical protein